MNSVVIVAAGCGRRMGGVDKLFFRVGGLALVGFCWRVFDGCGLVDEVVVVCEGGREDEFGAVAAGFGARLPFRLVVGGERRQDSVWSGVLATDGGAELVAVHDGARPCVSADVVGRCFGVAGRVGGCVVGRRVVDSLKVGSGDGFVVGSVDREGLWAVETPQVFRRDVLLGALGLVRERGLLVSDEAGACEVAGVRVGLVEGGLPNPKVTVRGDLGFVEWLLSRG